MRNVAFVGLFVLHTGCLTGGLAAVASSARLEGAGRGSTNFTSLDKA